MATQASRLNVRRSRIFILLLLAAFGVLAVGLVVVALPRLRLASSPTSQTGEAFHLYVSNQSFAIDPVDIVVRIDGEEVVNAAFFVEGQHNWQLFELKLPNGTHSLEVESKAGEVKLNQQFTTTAEQWAVIDFWYYPEDGDGKQFSFNLSDKPIGFD